MDLANVGVAVFCGSSTGGDAKYRAAATSLGRAIAEAGATLVYGGGSVGLMGVVADAALAIGGPVVGVIPHFLDTAEVAHAGVTEIIRVETMHERKAIMSDRCEAYVVLPGGFGTYDELIEVVTWKQLKLHDKPIVVVNVGGFFDSLIGQASNAVREGFIREEYLALMDVVRSPEDAMNLISAAPMPQLSRTART